MEMSRMWYSFGVYVMPYVSDAQRKYFHANKAKLERQGVNVSEWDRATKGRRIPKRKGKDD